MIEGMINLLRFWARWLFSVLTLVLLLTFMVRIFSPGNAETAYIFRAIQPIQPWLDQICAALVWPVGWALEKLEPFLPATWKAWFPISPAAAFFTNVSEWVLKIPGLAGTVAGKQMQAADYGALFPGVVDWRLLLALPVWGFAESLLFGLFIRMDAWTYRWGIRRRDAAFMKSLREPGHAGEAGLAQSSMLNPVNAEIGPVGGGDSQDFLTGLYSQSYLAYRLDREMQVARLNQGLLALLLIEIDDFQERVDANGPAIGDLMLTSVAPATQVKPPQGEAISCRYGDHQFVVLLTEPTQQTAEQLAEWIRGQVAQIHVEEAFQPGLGVSIGVYTVRFTPENGSQELTPAAFIAKADAQKYIAQRKGKNQISAAALI